jgi:hypothetical protein
MSITRTAPYGTVTDDSGGGTDGTIANNAWLQGHLDLLDARWSRTSITSTGTQTTINPSEADLLICNNASDLTIRSITAPSSPAKPGKKLTIVSTGADNVFLNHQDTNVSVTAANRLVNTATSSSTPLAAGAGRAVYIYDDANSRWRLVEHDQGAWIAPTFAAGDFTASSGSWTLASGDVTFDRFCLRGTLLFFEFRYITTTVSATPTELRRAIYNGYTVRAGGGRVEGIVMYQDNGGAETLGLLYNANSTTTNLEFRRLASTAWSTATNTTALQGNGFIEVQ